MPLLAKFNIIFISSFFIGLVIAGYLAYTYLQKMAEDDVLQNARLMMETATSSRLYTKEKIAPLLKTQHTQITDLSAHYEQGLLQLAQQPAPVNIAGLTLDQQTQVQTAQLATLRQLQDKVVSLTASVPKVETDVFYPQSVPAYGATEIFNNLRHHYSDYSYKEATLNPTNPRDKASDFEASLVEQFRNNATLKEVTGHRATEMGDTVYLAKPLAVSSAACLECHSTPEAAPASMVKIYGGDHGFGWKMNEIIGAQIIQVPASVPFNKAKEAFWTALIGITAIFAGTLIILNIALVFAVIRPIAKLSHLANEVSKGKRDLPDYEIKGKDEISVLANSFQRMYKSLSKAMKMLDKE